MGAYLDATLCVLSQAAKHHHTHPESVYIGPVEHRGRHVTQLDRERESLLPRVVLAAPLGDEALHLPDGIPGAVDAVSPELLPHIARAAPVHGIKRRTRCWGCAKVHEPEEEVDCGQPVVHRDCEHRPCDRGVCDFHGGRRLPAHQNVQPVDDCRHNRPYAHQRGTQRHHGLVVGDVDGEEQILCQQVPGRCLKLAQRGVDSGLVPPAHAPAVEAEEWAHASPVAEQDLVFAAGEGVGDGGGQKECG
jgi:hypothetical protein